MKQLVTLASMILMAFTAIHSHAVGTQAGVVIKNRASVTYNAGGSDITVDSLYVELTVQELVKATVETLDAGNISISSPQTNAPMKFKIQNDGNGNEGFKIVLTQPTGSDDFDTTTGNLYIDDGNGVLDINVDTLYDNATPPSIPAGDSIVVWVTATIPGGQVNGDTSDIYFSTVSATFVADGQNSPNSGAVVTSQGDNGTHAVNAAAAIFVTSTFVVSDIDVGIVKEIIAVRDGLATGSGIQPIPGAEVEYLITVTVTGTGTAQNVIVSDPLPKDLNNINYLQLKDGIAGTIKVAGTDLSASSSTDSKAVYDANTNTITVDLGNIDAGDPAIAIQFTTVIQ